jgi:serine/threonine-protein kinase RsbW
VVPDILCPGFTGSLLAGSDQAIFRLPATEGSVCEARRRVRATLSTWGAELCGDDMTLVVSELFTNAVRHTQSDRIEVSLWYSSGLLHLEVTDQGRSTDDVEARTADPDDESGRGLMLVEHLALGWGVSRSRHGHGRTVWAVIRPPEQDAAAKWPNPRSAPR